jgi:hypothetical protein
MNRVRPGRGRPRGALICFVAVAAIAACAPKLRPLGGEIAPATVPRAELPPGHHQVVFEWEFSDPDMSGRGDGVARAAAPDSVRLDFFLAGGFVSGAAVLIGDTLDIPGPDITRRFIPPPTLLWAAMGRTRLPATADTAIRRDGELLRADLGRPVQWRVTFRRDSLVRLEHVEGGRVVEWVDRGEGNHFEYRQEAAHRSLKLHITHVYDVGPFDASIWHIDR